MQSSADSERSYTNCLVQKLAYATVCSGWRQHGGPLFWLSTDISILNYLWDLGFNNPSRTWKLVTRPFLTYFWYYFSLPSYQNHWIWIYRRTSEIISVFCVLSFRIHGNSRKGGIGILVQQYLNFYAQPDWLPFNQMAWWGFSPRPICAPAPLSIDLEISIRILMSG